MVANHSAQVLQPIVYGDIASFIGLGVAFPISGVLPGATAVWMGRRLSALEN